MREKEHNKCSAKITVAVIKRDIPIEISAIKASLKQALKDDTRRKTILHVIRAEINKLEAPPVPQPLRYKNFPRGVGQIKSVGTCFTKRSTRPTVLSRRSNQNSTTEQPS